MNCIDCDFFHCKVFYASSETWTGFCMNIDSDRFHTETKGNDSCNINNINIKEYGNKQRFSGEEVRH